MPYTTIISTSELAERLDDPAWAIVDCRFRLDDPEWGRTAYMEAHIPGAVYAHLDEDISGRVIPGRTGRHPLPSPDTFVETLSDWGIGPSVQVVVYDDSNGAYAARLWWMLRWLGHMPAAVLDGGWAAWAQEGRPVHSGRETRPRRTFIPHIRPDLLVHAGEVETIRQDAGFRLLDARSADRYRGENETIDPVAGHIPGAISAPYTENLTPGGKFRPPGELLRRYSALLEDVPADRVVFYCGSGVTAAHNVLALMHAGLGEGRLYAGSWSEWITDPRRPVSREDRDGSASR